MSITGLGSEVKRTYAIGVCFEKTIEGVYQWSGTAGFICNDM